MTRRSKSPVVVRDSVEFDKVLQEFLVSQDIAEIAQGLISISEDASGVGPQAA